MQRIQKAIMNILRKKTTTRMIMMRQRSIMTKKIMTRILLTQHLESMMTVMKMISRCLIPKKN